MKKKDMEYKILLETEKTFYWMKCAELDARKKLGDGWREDLRFVERRAAYVAVNSIRLDMGLDMGLDASDGRYALDEDYSWFIEHTVLVLDELRELRAETRARRDVQKSLG